MTIKFEDINGYRFLIGKAIKQDIHKRWISNIFMCENGYGKHFYDEEIDALADFLIEYYNQTIWS